MKMALALCAALVLAACSGSPPSSLDHGVAGFLMHVELPEGAALRCDFPDSANMLTRCEARDGYWLVAAADLKDWWNGDRRRLRLVTLYVTGSNEARVRMVQMDSDTGDLINPAEAGAPLVIQVSTR